MDFHSWDNYLHQTGSKGFLESTAKKNDWNKKNEKHETWISSSVATIY